MKIKSKRHRDTDLWHNKCVGNMNGNLLRPTSTKWIENISEYKETIPPLIQRYKDTKIQTALQPPAFFTHSPEYLFLNGYR